MILCKIICTYVGYIRTDSFGLGLVGGGSESKDSPRLASTRLGGLGPGPTSSYFVIVEANSHLKLHPISILDIYTVFEHIDILSIGMQLQPYTVIPLGF